jgi:catalase
MPKPKSIIGKSRETYQEELFGGIERGKFPRWTVHGSTDHAGGRCRQDAL